MELSKRLYAIASFVSRGNTLADIGTDHGYIPIYLVKHEICPKAFAMDVNQGPLDKAITNVRAEGLEQQIMCIKSNGLEYLPENQVDTIVIAGMGGDLMEQILVLGEGKLKDIQELVLSPQSHPEKVRQFLHNHGFMIQAESMLKEDGKFYLILHATRGIEHFQEEYLYLYGKKLLEAKDETMGEYLELELKSVEKILESFSSMNLPSVETRRIQLTEKKKNIMEALTYYEV
ncbi:MAG: class I SAM-dependent methyltransferase [Anaerostipes sp.]|nr:class I SAM-dependent methyltransferase [Anaerostipes sp.]